MILKFNGHILHMYDSIQSLPITRHQLYNLNLMIDVGIGSDIGAFDQKMNQSKEFINAGQGESAIKEMNNIQQNIRFIMSKTSPKYRSFVVMIHKINGVEIDDSELSDDGIKKIIKDLGKKKMPHKIVLDFLRDVKKKLNNEFDVFFKSMVSNSTTTEFYNKLKKRSILILKSVQDNSIDYAEQIKQIDFFLLSKNKPKNYFGSDGLEVRTIKGFEQTCSILNQHSVSFESRNMTTLAFYEALAMVKEQIKQRNKK